MNAAEANVTPVGRPDAFTVTVELKPPMGERTSEPCAELPRANARVAGVALRVKPGTTTVRLMTVLAVRLPDVPLIAIA